MAGQCLEAKARQITVSLSCALFFLSPHPFLSLKKIPVCLFNTIRPPSWTFSACQTHRTNTARFFFSFHRDPNRSTAHRIPNHGPIVHLITFVFGNLTLQTRATRCNESVIEQVIHIFSSLVHPRPTQICPVINLSCPTPSTIRRRLLHASKASRPPGQSGQPCHQGSPTRLI